MIFIFWLMLTFQIMIDILRSHDLTGPMRAFWVLFILVLALLGALIYLLPRDHSMHEQQFLITRAEQKQFEDYI